jgi:hypothetical protein
MPISRSHEKKSPSQNPVDFFKCQQQGGEYGKPMSVPDVLKGGPMREKIMGNPVLSGSMDPSRSTMTHRTGGSQGAGSGTHPIGPEHRG